MLEVDPIELVRRRDGDIAPLKNTSTTALTWASSFMSVAIGDVFGTAMAGRCKERPELAAQPLPLEATITVLPCRGGEAFLRRLLGPLGTRSKRRRTSLTKPTPSGSKPLLHGGTSRGVPIE